MLFLKAAELNDHNSFCLLISLFIICVQLSIMHYNWTGLRDHAEKTTHYYTIDVMLKVVHHPPLIHSTFILFII